MSSLGPGVTTWAFFAFWALRQRQQERAAQRLRPQAGEPQLWARTRARSAATGGREPKLWGRKPRCRTRPAGGAAESWTTSQGRLRTRSARSSVGAKPALQTRSRLACGFRKAPPGATPNRIAGRRGRGAGDAQAIRHGWHEKAACQPAQRCPQGRPQAAGAPTSRPQGGAVAEGLPRREVQARQGVLRSKTTQGAQALRRTSVGSAEGFAC